MAAGHARCGRRRSRASDIVARSPPADGFGAIRGHAMHGLAGPLCSRAKPDMGSSVRTAGSRPWLRCASRLASLALLALVHGAAGAAATDQLGVLVIYADGRVQPGFVTIDDAIRTQLARIPPERLAYYNEYLDVIRFPLPADQARMASYVADKYRGRRLDLVICVRDAALDFALRHRDAFAPGVPILHFMVERDVVQRMSLPAGVAGLPFVVDAAPMVALARTLHPDPRFVVVGGTTEFDERWIRAFRRELGDDARWLVGLSLEETEREVAALPAGSVVLLAIFGRDGRGRTYIPLEAARRIVAASSAPCYGGFSNIVGTGAVGGAVLDIWTAGSAAGAAALRILEGARPAELDLRELRSDQVQLDWRQLRRWRIPETAVPAGALVLHRQPGFWERNRRFILLTAGALMVQSLLIGCLLVSRRSLRRTQARLLEGERRMSLATDATALGIWLWELADDAIWASDSWYRLLGLASGGRCEFARFMSCIHGDDRAGVEAVLRRALADGTDCACEFRADLGGGNLRWISGRARVERDAQGRPQRMFGVLLDVGERKRIENEAERHRAELAHLARVASLGELSSSIAHELNQPLGAILSNAQAALLHLDETPPDCAQLREILGDIVRHDRRASEVIKRMHAMLRRDGTHMAPLDLRQVVVDVLGLMRSELIERQVTCVTDLGAAPAPVLGDRVQLQQVLINLVVNACDAMAQQPPERRRLAIAIADDGGVIHCDVLDQGPGIPTADRERIFDPFVSTKPHGLGMGLSICRTIVAAHAGTLDVHDHPAGGACLRLLLPRCGDRLP